MARKQRWSRPSSVYLYRTPGGWRHLVSLVDGGMVCGGLGELSASVPVEQAQAKLRETVEFLLEGDGTVFLRWAPGGDGWVADVEISGNFGR